MTIDKVKEVALEKYGKTLTDEQAAKYAEKYGKLTDDELDKVSGGYGVCQDEYHSGVFCEPCGVWCDCSDSFYGTSFKCPVCGAIHY